MTLSHHRPPGQKDTVKKKLNKSDTRLSLKTKSHTHTHTADGWLCLQSQHKRLCVIISSSSARRTARNTKTPTRAVMIESVSATGAESFFNQYCTVIYILQSVTTHAHTKFCSKTRTMRCEEEKDECDVCVWSCWVISDRGFFLYFISGVSFSLKTFVSMWVWLCVLCALVYCGVIV